MLSPSIFPDSDLILVVFFLSKFNPGVWVSEWHIHTYNWLGYERTWYLERFEGLHIFWFMLFDLIYKFLVISSLRYQKKEEGELPFGIEDLLYYVKRVEEQSYDLDFGEIKQYLPISLVLSGIFKIVQDLFGNFKSDNLFKVMFYCLDHKILLILKSNWKVILGKFIPD